jgi:hypothetical protein
MQLIGALVLLTVWIGNAAALAQSAIHEDFQTANLDWNVWCLCQINMSEAPITFPLDQDQAGDRVLLVTADETSLGGNKCRSNAPDLECRPPLTSAALAHFDNGNEISFPLNLPEPLGPSLIRLRGMELAEASPKNPYCTDEVERRAKTAGEEGCIQRQELRFQKRYWHDINKPRLYSFRFRMPEMIEDQTNSIRWIIAQWKQVPISEKYCRQFNCEKWGPSPFLALRFDDGVLHVTVQDEHCRCKVASAPLPDGSNSVWVDGLAQYCMSSKPTDPDGSTCTPDLHVQYGKDPILSPPLGRWIEMRLRVAADRSRRAVIEIHQNDRFIVRVTGKIGYEQERGIVSKTKFKIGHYRDYMPFVHAMMIDWLTVTPVTE